MNTIFQSIFIISTLQTIIRSIYFGYMKYPIQFIISGVIFLLMFIIPPIILRKHNKRIIRREKAVDKWMSEGKNVYDITEEELDKYMKLFE